jgi:hypothetical protein
MNGIEQECVCRINTGVIGLSASNQLFDPSEASFHFFHFIFDNFTRCSPVIALIKEQFDIAFTYDDTI